MKQNNQWTIDVGGMSKYELLMQLTEKKIAMNAYATLLFMDDRFQTSSKLERAEIVELSVQTLGLKSPALFDEITDKAMDLGLELCPMELAPHFRLQYIEPDEGSILTVASQKLSNDEHFPNGFYLRHYGGFHWLRGYRSTSDWLWELQDRFVFMSGYE